MSPRGATLLAGLLLLLAPALISAQNAEGDEETSALPEVKLDIRPAEITVGEPVLVELSLIFPPEAEEIEPRMPAWQETWGPAEILLHGQADPFQDSSGRRIFRQMVTLTAFEVGSVRLPPLAIALPYASGTREVRTPEGRGFEVASVLPEGEEEVAPKGAAAPLGRSAGRAFLWTVLVLSLLNLAAAWHLLRRLARGSEESQLERLAPLEELLRRLGQVDPSEGPEPVHTRLSLALRRYLGRSLGFPGTESTTSEIQRRLRGAPLPMELTQRALGLLRLFDQVKFARASVDPAASDERRAGTEHLAREIETVLHPPETPETAEASR